MNAKHESSSGNQTVTDLLADAEVAIVKEILSDELSVDTDQITPQARLVEDLGADSIDQISIVMRLEERFNVTLTEEQTEAVETVEDLGEVLAKVLRHNSCK